MANEIDLRDLRYFRTIAELGHFGKAAQRLNRSQPTLTGAVRRLENTFGTPFFQRIGRGIQLTPAGEILLLRARQLLLTTDDIARELDDLSSGAAGQVRIGLVPTAARYLLPAISRNLLVEHSNVTLKTVIGQNDVLAASLKAGNLDLVIGLVRAPDSKTEDEFVSNPVLEDVVVVVASRSHAVFKQPACMEELLNHRWVLASKSVESRRWLDEAFELRGLPRPTAQIETNLVLLLPPLIVDSGLLSFISRLHLGPGGVGSTLREVPLKETTMRRWFNVITRKDAYLPPAAQRVVKLLRTHGKKLAQV